jgi:hypothetical protein
MDKDAALNLALEALENSVDLVREDAYNAEKLYGNYPSRQGKVAGLKVLADDHEKAITAINQALAAPVQPEQEPVAWLCGRSNGDTFALTVKQLRELGYGNISMPPFKKLAPLFTALAQQEMAHDRMMDDALTIGSAWVRDGTRLEPTSVYKSMEEDT